MSKRDFDSYTATLYTIASICDVGNQLLRQSGRNSGLPRTFEEYIRRLYGAPSRNWFLVLNYGLLTAIVAFVIVVLTMVRF